MEDTTRAAIAQVIERLWPEGRKVYPESVKEDCKIILQCIANGLDIEVVDGVMHILPPRKA